MGIDLEQEVQDIRRRRGRLGVLMRDRMCKYVNAIAITSPDVPQALAAVADHVQVNGDGAAHDDPDQRKAADALSVPAVRALIGITSAHFAMIGFTPQQAADEMTHNAPDTVAYLVAACMGVSMSDRPTLVVMEALTQMLDTDERLALLCYVQAFMRAVGFSVEDIRYLYTDQAAPVSTRDSVDQGETFASMDDRGLDDRGPVGKSETD